MKSFTKLAFFISLIVILVLLYFFYPKDKNIENTANVISTEERFLNSGVQNNVSNVEIKEKNNSKNIFYHPQYKFSFEYATNINVSNFKEGGGEQQQLSSKHQGTQV